MSKRQKQSGQSLPGLEALVVPANVRPCDVDMTDEQVFTAGVLFSSHPDVFKSAATMLFKYGDSERKIAEILRISTNTVRAIRDMVVEGAATGDSAAAAAFFIKSRAANARRTVQLRALEVIKDRLDDPDEAKKIGIETLISVTKLDGPDDDSSAHPKAAAPTIIDVDEFDDVLNGLDGEKKNAASVPAADGPAASAMDELDRRLDGDCGTVECSTRSAENSQRSFELSGSSQCLRALRETSCNSLCNSSGPSSVDQDPGAVGPASSAVDRTSSGDAPASAVGARKDPGGGGAPAPAASGGVD